MKTSLGLVFLAGLCWVFSELIGWVYSPDGAGLERTVGVDITIQFLSSGVWVVLGVALIVFILSLFFSNRNTS
jgi:hypothetical protein